MSKLALAAVIAVAVTSLTSVAMAQRQTYRSPNPPSTVSCDSQLGHLPRVYREDVGGIDDHQRVWVTELCADFGMLRSEGNAEYLRPAIAANAVLRDVLGAKGHTAEDVFAIKMMGEDTIHLYVHDFGR